MAVRPQGEDFRSSMPGAELEGLYAMGSGAEVLKLGMRAFWYLGSHPERVVPEEPGPIPEKGVNAPEASGLPYRRIVVAEE
jgi:hypothetical protein